MDTVRVTARNRVIVRVRVSIRVRGRLIFLRLWILLGL